VQFHACEEAYSMASIILTNIIHLHLVKIMTAAKRFFQPVVIKMMSLSCSAV